VSPAAVVTTLAGSGSAAFADGTALQAAFNAPRGLALDGARNALYIADRSNHRIRAMALDTLVVSTLAGGGGASYVEGVRGGAAFNAPSNLALDVGGGRLFVSDGGNNVVRSVLVEGSQYGATATIAGTGAVGAANGAALSATFNSPTGLAWDAASANLWVADSGGNTVRLIAPCPSTSTPTPSPSTGASPSFTPSASRAGSPTPSSTPAGRGCVFSTLAGSGAPAFANGAGAAAAFSGPPRPRRGPRERHAVCGGHGEQPRPRGGRGRAHNLAGGRRGGHDGGHRHLRAAQRPRGPRV
jgi:DNA-binding beta-propeller fold protein YncE